MINDPAFEIRALAVDDATAYWEIRLRALRECPEAFAASYEEEAETPPDARAERFRKIIGPPGENFILGAWRERDLVGMVGLYREKRQKLHHRAVIVSMYVIPEMHGRGLGRALITEAIAQARNWPGLEQINLTVVATNEPARRLYLSLGFKTYGLERHALKVGDRYMNDEHMVMFLRES